MRIGIDARMFSSSFTGIGRYTFELVRHLNILDQENNYVIFLNSPEYEKFQLPSSHFTKRLANAQHYSWREQVYFCRLLKKEKLDLMHFTHFNAPFFYRKPSVVTIHDLTLSFFPGKKMTSWLHRIGYYLVLHSIVKRAKKIIAVSKNTKKDLEKICRIDAKKLQVIYEGVAEEFFRKMPTKSIATTLDKFNLKQDFLLYTGVWRDHKNVTGLITAFAQARKNGLNGLLVITGKENPAYPEVKVKIAELNLDKFVCLTGLVSETELLALYQSARMYVFPSFYEGFGLPILEAFASKTPVVASNTSSIPEICGKDNALFFDPYNTSDMAEKILQVWRDENLREQLIVRGQKRVQDFSWEKMAKETLRVYESVNSEQ